jgi:hypothetical protein
VPESYTMRAWSCAGNLVIHTASRFRCITWARWHPYRASTQKQMPYFRQAAILWRDLAGVLAQIAITEAEQGQPERAVRLLAASEHLRRETGEGMRADDEEEVAQAVRAMRDLQSETEFAAAWATGQAMTLEQAVAYALA